MITVDNYKLLISEALVSDLDQVAQHQAAPLLDLDVLRELAHRAHDHLSTFTHAYARGVHACVHGGCNVHVAVPERRLESSRCWKTRATFGRDGTV